MVLEGIPGRIVSHRTNHRGPGSLLGIPTIPIID